MRKNNKKLKLIALILSTLLATNCTTVFADDIPPNNSDEPNSMSNIVNTVMEVTSTEDLSIALENPKVEEIHIKSNIIFDNTYDTLTVYGNKTLIGNNYSIETNNNFNKINIEIKGNIHITDLKLYNVQINSDNDYNAYITIEDSEVLNTNLNTRGNTLLNNITLKDEYYNGELSANIGGYIDIRNSSIHGYTVSSYGTVDIADTEFSNSKIMLGSMSDISYIKNVTIRNSSEYAIKLYNGADLKIDGYLNLDNITNEGIFLSAEVYHGWGEGGVDLYVNGEINQIGNTFTIKAEKEGISTRVHDSLNILQKGEDEEGTAYYNTPYRQGDEPQLPNAGTNTTMEVNNFELLVKALSNPKVKEVILTDNIEFQNNNTCIEIASADKTIIGNNYAITSFENNEFTNIKLKGTLKFYQCKLENLNIDSDNDFNSNLVLEDSELINCNLSTRGTTTLNNVKLFDPNQNGYISSNLTSTLNILNSIIDGYIISSYGSVNMSNSQLFNGQVALGSMNDMSSFENITITNSKTSAIKVFNGADLTLDGYLILDKISNEGIYLSSEVYHGWGEGGVELFINGSITQIGDTYTIKAEKEGTSTKVHDNISILSKGQDDSGNAYYNTNNREGLEPELPNSNLENKVVVTDEISLINGLINPNVNTIVLNSDIELLNTHGTLTVLGSTKTIKGKGYSIKNNNSNTELIIELKGNLTFNNIDIENITIDSDNDYNSKLTIKNSDIINCSLKTRGTTTLDFAKFISTNNNHFISANLGSIIDIINSDLVGYSISSYGIVNMKNSSINKGQIKMGSMNDTSIFEDVKISNSKEQAITLFNGADLIINGTLTLDNISKEGIYLSSEVYHGWGDGGVELTVNGTINQIGDTYTIIAEKEVGDVSSVTFDKKKLRKGENFKGDSYYNTRNRNGKAPKLPKAVYKIKTVSNSISGIAEPNSQVALSFNNLSNANVFTETIVSTNSLGEYTLELTNQLECGEEIRIVSYDNSGNIVGSITETVEEINSDINNDGVIDIFDISEVALSYNIDFDSDLYYDINDINGDNIIDLFDIILIAKNIN